MGGYTSGSNKKECVGKKWEMRKNGSEKGSVSP